ncbi:MAG: hypothetical protein A3F40_00610 [Chlamydiae bacterium RIFCSPHIGHO2_12_FULL_27_8]|nr:MAG: hypothetical protein A3F40_00610 [Chlamydiae bacterium RIFCSPHIGHO2_12_FULL_27_8]
MELEVFNREKKGINKLRAFDNVPGVIYSKGSENKNIFFKKADFKNILSKLKSGDLSTLVFTLKNEKESFKAIVKDIQYFITSYDVSHVDFMKINDKEEISVNVPVRLKGVQECSGVKLGGSLMQMLRAIKIKCLPKKMPKEIVLDVTNLNIGDRIKINEISLDQGLKVKAKNFKEVIVSVIKK